MTFSGKVKDRTEQSKNNVSNNEGAVTNTTVFVDAISQNGIENINK